MVAYWYLHVWFAMILALNPFGTLVYLVVTFLKGVTLLNRRTLGGCHVGYVKVLKQLLLIPASGNMY